MECGKINLGRSGAERKIENSGFAVRAFSPRFNGQRRKTSWDADKHHFQLSFYYGSPILIFLISALSLKMLEFFLRSFDSTPAANSVNAKGFRQR